MGLFKRVNDIITANLHDLVDKCEDPEKALKQAIREMEEAIQTATAETTKVLANQKRLEKEIARNESEVQRFNSQAAERVDASDDDGARQALVQASKYSELTESLKEQLELATESSNLLKNQLDGMREKLEEAKRNQATLSARNKAAEVRKKSVMATSSDGAASLEKTAFDKFERLREKVEMAEAEAEALAEITSETSGRPAPAEPNVEMQLAALKASRSES